MVSERRQPALVRRHGVPGEVARHGAFQPLSLIGDALVLASFRFLFDLREFGPQPFAHTLPPELELAAPGLRRDVREPHEVEGFRSPEALPAVVRLGEPAERDQAGFLRMQGQATAVSRSRSSSRKRRASSSSWKPTMVSSAYRTTIISPPAWRFRHCCTHRS